MKVRTLSPVVASQTLHRIDLDAVNTLRPSLDQQSAVIGSVSPGRLCTTLPVPTSTMFTASWHAAATIVPSCDSRHGPPV